MEYASPVWNGLFAEADADGLEKIQAEVARYLLKVSRRTPKKKELLQQLGLPALGWRRNIISMVLFHKLVNYTRLPLSDLLVLFRFLFIKSFSPKTKATNS